MVPCYVGSQNSKSTIFRLVSSTFLEESPLSFVPRPEITKFSQVEYVNLTSHSNTFGTDPIPVSWGHPDPLVRGPVVCTVRHSSQRNAIGAHQGSYCIYTGLAVRLMIKPCEEVHVNHW